MINPVIIPHFPLTDWFKKDAPSSVELQIVDTIMRGIKVENRRSFFEFSLKEIPDPSLLKDMRQSVDLILSHVRDGKRILIVGDYDVDGVTSVTLLVRFFKIINFSNYDIFIPNRFSHGYGLSNKSVDAILEKNPRLVVTVDNGISSKVEIGRIKNLGIEVIVTDHHSPIEASIPDCLIVNTKQTDCPYPYKDLSGVGIVFLLLVALRAELRKRGYWNQQRPEPNLVDHLDLVALGTIADQVPLTGLNRIFAKYGLEQMTKRIHENLSNDFFHYIQAFAHRSTINCVNSDTIAFQLAPLLNAAGRMKDAMDSVDFLLSENPSSARSRFSQLERLNVRRRKKQQSMSKKAIDIAKSLIKTGKGLLVYDDSFHEGLIGIIASRLVDKFYMPCVVLTKGEQGILKASCRSKNDDILEKLSFCSPLLKQYGGHANAAGCSLETENLDAFHQRFTEACSEYITSDKERRFEALIEVRLEMMTFSLIDHLKPFEPYGQENRKTIFVTKDISLPDPTILSDNHLKWTMDSDLEMIFWNGKDSWKRGERYDVAFTLGENTFRGIKKRQLIVKAISTHKTDPPPSSLS